MYPRVVPWIAVAIAAAGAAHAQTDPLFVRLNGTKAMTQRVLPALAGKNGGLAKSVAEVPVASETRTLLGFGLHSRVWLSDVRVEVPVASDDLTAAFAVGTSNRARLHSDYHFDRASLRMTYHVETTPVNPLIALPEELALDQAYAIEVTGARGELDVLAKPAQGFLEVETVEKFTVAVDSVKVHDSGQLTEIANGALGIGLLFGARFAGCETVNRCFTLIANWILRDALDLRKTLLPVLNASLRAVHAQGFLDQSPPFAQGAKLDVSASLSAIGSKIDFATTGWNVSLVGSPGGKVPGLAWSFAARPAEDKNASPPQGDLDAFVPYTLVDKALYEALQVGLLEPIPVELAAGELPSIATRRFTLVLTPTAVPRAKPDPTKPGALVVEFAAALEDTSIGTVALPGQAQPVSTSGAGARAMLETGIDSNARGALRVTLRAIRLEELAGWLLVGNRKASPMSALRVPIERALNQIIRKENPRIELASHTVALESPLAVRIGTVQLGTQYIRVPLSIVTQ